MALTSDIIHGFVATFLRTRYDNPQPTPTFHKELWDYSCLPNKYVALAAPRGFAKSTALTFSDALANLVFREKEYIVIISNTEEQSKDFLGSIKREILENQKLCIAFGIKRLIRDNETDIIVEFTDGAKFRVVVKGAGQKLRGMKWGNKRPDRVYCDDLEDDDQVLNDDRRTKFRKWFFNAVIPLLADNGDIRVVGTILHMDALLERLMPENQFPEHFKNRIRYIEDNGLKVTSSYPEAVWKSVRYRAHPGPEDFSQLLWPSKWPEKRLREVRQTYLNDGYPEGYAQEYLNNPIDDTLSYFRPEDFIEAEETAGPMTIYVGGDFAISQKQKADYTVFAVVGVAPTGVIKVLDIRKGRWDSYEIVEEILSIRSAYNPELFLFENGQIFLAIEPVLIRTMQETGVYIPYDTVNPIGDKELRAQSLRSRMRAHMVQFDKTASWFEDLFSEMRRFPRDVHDDQVDALSTIGRYLNKLQEARTVEEIEEEELEMEEWNSMDLSSGISKMCGY